MRTVVLLAPRSWPRTLYRNPLSSITHVNYYPRKARAFTMSLPNPSPAKRKAISPPRRRASKKPKIDIPEYHSTPTVKNEAGKDIWPAPQDQLDNARRVIRECAGAQTTTVICPDKDADGLTSGAILKKTLELLGLDKDLIHTHFLPKGETVHKASQRNAISAFNPSYVFILDHGSAHSEAIADPQQATTLVIDHHFATPKDFPDQAEWINACNSPPVATSSLLTYEICLPLHRDVEESCSWLCCIGTHGDLGNTLKWEAPFPDMKATFKKYTKKGITDAVSMLNGPRRTAEYDVKSAWDALWAAVESPDPGPRALMHDKRLLAARAEVNAEVERCTHTPPKFSPDGKICVLKINSKAQVHPMIAIRWASHLPSNKLEVVMCANFGYIPDRVNFSCRIARAARAKDPPVDIISVLKDAAAAHESGTLTERMGKEFAKGHVQASGGIVGESEFEELMEVMKIGEKPDNPSPRKGPKPTQANTLTNYFSKT